MYIARRIVLLLLLTALCLSLTSAALADEATDASPTDAQPETPVSEPEQNASPTDVQPETPVIEPEPTPEPAPEQTPEPTPEPTPEQGTEPEKEPDDGQTDDEGEDNSGEDEERDEEVKDEIKELIETHPAYNVEANQARIYTFLTQTVGLNTAAACGIIGTMWGESAFDPYTLGDHNTSFGICQWHDWGNGVGRWTNLKNFCETYGYDYRSLDGQLYFLHYELVHGYSGIFSTMLSFPNTAEGAYEAGYYWCYYYGVPDDRVAVSTQRGTFARDIFWPQYAPPCVVTFDADGGVGVGSMSVSYKTSLMSLPKTTRPGYTFGGWYSEKNGGGDRLTTETVLLEDTTWYAHWDAADYTVSFDTQGAEDELTAISVTYGDQYGTLMLPDRDGYRFDGWYTAPSGGRQVGSETTSDIPGDHTLYAHWTSYQTYILYCDEAADSPLPQEKTIGADCVVTGNIPRQSAYVFVGGADTVRTEDPAPDTQEPDTV